MNHSAFKYTFTTIVALSVLLSLLVASNATAQAPATNSQETMGQMERATPGMQRSEVRQSALAKNIQDRIVNLTTNAIVRLNAGATRMRHILTRIETRIEKLKAQGIDTSSAEPSLTTARAALSAAENTLAEIGSVENVVSSDKPGEAFRVIRTQLLGVRDLLKQTHSYLVETLTLLKAAVQSGQGLPDSASSTNSVQ